MIATTPSHLESPHRLGWVRAARRRLVPMVAGLAITAIAAADNFGAVRFDPGSGQLIVVMRYRGSNPDHNFSLQWGECKPATEDGKLPEVAVDVIDDQFRDRALQDYKKTVRFDLSGMPCRPARVTLRTAPRYYYQLTIPQ